MTDLERKLQSWKHFEEAQTAELARAWISCVGSQRQIQNG
jgi:hypothetical protein